VNKTATSREKTEEELRRNSKLRKAQHEELQDVDDLMTLKRYSVPYDGVILMEEKEFGSRRTL
jgi:hypothetical protein